ncbi:DNAJ heat shock N-terminal domain-containing protein [Zea mays]|uniref:DNAJ heat shock N-terminal domain-containing protein n=3 Tax=Zea mays TaxID=4577 RepID=K7U5M9_MAIZE|nr:DNAJ heat shock N-terminal domain-containing protein [Zea mays]AQK45276.1 DNAJ heat shock N-terminal domain-containing protein [Zea mays]
MGRDGEQTRRRSRKRSRDASPSSSDSDSFDSPSSPSSSPERRSRSSKRNRSSSSHRHSRKKSDRSRRSRDEDRRRRRRRGQERKRHGGDGGRSSDSQSSEEDRAEEAREIVRDILIELPAIAEELRQLLQIIDSGESIDISGISDKLLVKRLKKLFRSLRLKESASGAYLLPSKNVPTLDIVGSLLLASSKLADNKSGKPVSPNREALQQANFDVQNKDKDYIVSEEPKIVDVEEEPPKRRIIGPAMPSRELLAAAAEMTEALRCRDAELEANDDLLIGPPPPAVVAEAASANEAERFEEVTRILAADTNSPYEVLGVNWKMSTDNMKKRYWKLSLLVHPDKCPHPSAQEAFVKLNNAFKDLQDPDKRGAIDEKIKKKEEMEQFEVELKAMREAAEWRRIQGVSLAGDDELLAGPKESQRPTRDEWMTTLPPERKAGVPMHSTTSFSMNGKEGRGDTSVWTDTPLDRAQKAQQSYLEAYNKTKAIAEGDDVKSKNPDASIVDKYNTSKRSVSLVQKHRESKKEKKKQKQQEKEEWEGSHPWKPWDREKDLSAGRQNVALDAENMSQGLSSRFASGAVQRNFL